MSSTGDALPPPDLRSAREVYAFAYGSVREIVSWDHRPGGHKLAAIEKVVSEAEATLERLKEQELG